VTVWLYKYVLLWPCSSLYSVAICHFVLSCIPQAQTSCSLLIFWLWLCLFSSRLLLHWLLVGLVSWRESVWPVCWPLCDILLMARYLSSSFYCCSFIHSCYCLSLSVCHYPLSSALHMWCSVTVAVKYVSVDLTWLTVLISFHYSDSMSWYWSSIFDCLFIVHCSLLSHDLLIRQISVFRWATYSSGPAIHHCLWRLWYIPVTWKWLSFVDLFCSPVHLCRSKHHESEQEHDLGSLLCTLLFCRVSLLPHPLCGYSSLMSTLLAKNIHCSDVSFHSFISVW